MPHILPLFLLIVFLLATLSFWIWMLIECLTKESSRK